MDPKKNKSENQNGLRNHNSLRDRFILSVIIHTRLLAIKFFGTTYKKNAGHSVPSSRIQVLALDIGILIYSLKSTNHRQKLTSRKPLDW